MEPGRLDVLLLLDDARELAGQESTETFSAISEVVEALEASLKRLGHPVRSLSFDRGLMGVITALAEKRPDVIFQLGQPEPTNPASEWHVTGLLELMGLAHSSESAETLVLACDKIRAKGLFAQAGIPSPAYAVSARGELPPQLPPGPSIAKPSREDGSRGIHAKAVAQTKAELEKSLASLSERFHQPILVETFLTGRELQVGVVGGELLPFVELDFSGLPPDRPKMAGYESKWKYDSAEFKGLHYHCPAALTPELAAAVRKTALDVVAAFGLRRCARLDLRLDEAGRVYVLDVNPNPDLSPVATFYTMAVKAGWGFDGLVSRLLALAAKSSGVQRA